MHYSVTKEQLKVLYRIYVETLCEKYGPLKFCKIHWDKMGRSKVNFLLIVGKIVLISKETAIAGYFNQANA